MASLKSNDLIEPLDQLCIGDVERSPISQVGDSPHQSSEVFTVSDNASPSGWRRSADGMALTCNAPISKALAVRLYTSHFLTAWNSRVYEAAVVYFLATTFPDTLMPISIYALVRNAAAIALTAPLGTWIDHGNRLTVVRASILGQRIPVATSCALFWIILWKSGIAQRTTYGLFAVIVMLGCIEKLSSGVNLVSVERDWIVVITEGDQVSRRLANARLRRIDLFCKLIGPLTISSIAAVSLRIAVYSTLATNVASVLIEYMWIEKVLFLRICSQ